VLRCACIVCLCVFSVWIGLQGGNDSSTVSSNVRSLSLRRLHDSTASVLLPAVKVYRASETITTVGFEPSGLNNEGADGPANTHGDDDGGHEAGGHPSLFEALSAIHIEIGTYSVLVIIGFIIILKQILETLYTFTHESAFHGMVKKIEEELMIVGSSSFIFKVVMNTTTFSTNRWAYPLEFGEVLVPLIAFSYCFVGLFLVIVSLKQCYTWSRAHNLKVMEILDDYLTESKTWWFAFTWMPLNKSIEQMEFRIFHNIFCKTFKIKKGAFAFDEYVEKVFQHLVLELIEIRLLDWLYVTVLLFLNMARVKLDIHINSCSPDENYIECDNKRTVRMFTLVGKCSPTTSQSTYWAIITAVVRARVGSVIFLSTFLLLVLSRRLELAILRRNGLKSHCDYVKHVKVRYWSAFWCIRQQT
jgi:hypothetical protein